MKKVVFNGYSLVNEEIYGIQRNTLELLKELDKMIQPNTVELLIPPKGKRKLNFDNIRVVEVGSAINCRISIISKIRSLCWRRYTFSRYIKGENALSVDTLLNYYAKNIDVFSIYDCIPEILSSCYKTISQKIHLRMILRNNQRKINEAKIVFTDSKSAKSDIVRIYNVDPNKVVVIPCAWQHFRNIQEDNSILRRLNLNKKGYFFSLGSRREHKNAKWIIAAAKQNNQYTFVVSGSFFEKSDVVSTDTTLPNVIYTGYLSDNEIKALMHYCRAFIQPSIYEGFGLPPMEAMSVGASCIVSNSSSLPEIYGESVWYINPLDYDNINLDKIMSKDIENSEEVLKRFSWKRSAELMWAKLSTLL